MKPYDRVLSIAKFYLGPAAESFLERQCKLHLKIDALQITLAHLKAFGALIEVAAVRFIDPAKAKAMAQRITALGM
jgi:hypothetical protein